MGVGVSFFMFGEIKEQTANSTRFSQVITGVSELMSGQLHLRLSVHTVPLCSSESKSETFLHLIVSLSRCGDTLKLTKLNGRTGGQIKYGRQPGLAPQLRNRHHTKLALINSFSLS